MQVLFSGFTLVLVGTKRFSLLFCCSCASVELLPEDHETAYSDGIHGFRKRKREEDNRVHEDGPIDVDDDESAVLNDRHNGGVAASERKDGIPEEEEEEEEDMPPRPRNAPSASSSTDRKGEESPNPFALLLQAPSDRSASFPQFEDSDSSDTNPFLAMMADDASDTNPFQTLLSEDGDG